MLSGSTIPRDSHGRPDFSKFGNADEDGDGDGDKDGDVDADSETGSEPEINQVLCMCAECRRMRDGVVVVHLIIFICEPLPSLRIGECRCEP